MMLDANVTPLRRSWCLFELLQTFLLKDGTASVSRPVAGGSRMGFGGLLLLTPKGVLNTGNGSIDTAMNIGRQLAELDLAQATASHEADQQMIHQEVRNKMGGFEVINAKLRTEINSVLRDMSYMFTADLQELTARLQPHDGADDERPPAGPGRQDPSLVEEATDPKLSEHPGSSMLQVAI